MDERDTETDFKLMPDMSMTTSIPRNADIAVQFNAEMWTKNGAELQLQLVIGGTPVEGTVVELTAESETDVHSYILSAKHLNPEGNILLAPIEIHWRRQGGDEVGVADRAMNLLLKTGDVPDLSSPPNLGRGSKMIEPQFGVRNLFTI